jgi:hypothetical protein
MAKELFYWYYQLIVDTVTHGTAQKKGLVHVQYRTAMLLLDG